MPNQVFSQSVLMQDMQTILIAAITLDGKIAKNAGHNNNWTSKADKKIFRSEVKKAGAVIFGAGTYQAMGCRAFPDALNIIMTRTPARYQARSVVGQLEFTDDSPPALIDKLKNRDYTRLIIAGGQSIYSLFLQANLVQKIYLTIAPKIFGGGLNLFKEIRDLSLNFNLLSTRRLGQDEVLLKYKVKIKN